MGKDYRGISLEQLKEDMSQFEDRKLGGYFDDKLSMAPYRDENGYTIIIEFFNHLKDEYNECVNRDKAGAAVYHETLFRTFSWFFPFLTPSHKFIAQSNICILADDEQESEFHKAYFEKSLTEANRLVETMEGRIYSKRDECEKEVLCRALDSVGYLNIREHNYIYAMQCYRLCIDLLLGLDADNPANSELFDLYIRSIVRLAKCYEYTDEPFKAIKYMLDLENLKDAEKEWKEIIISNAEQIIQRIIAYYNLPDHKLLNKDATIAEVREICQMFFGEEKRHCKFFLLSKTRKPLSWALKSYIHVLAHCISEYAAKVRESDYSHPFCSVLQMFSRFLLDWLVVSCHEEALVTCQATVRAENDACPEALKLLLKRHKELDGKGETCSREEQNELQEIEFFLFYFSEQELRYNYKDEILEDIFRKYGDKFLESAFQKSQAGDFDPLFHYYVIKFKYLFKQKVDEFIHISEKERLNTQEVDNVFLEMCRCKERCSDHIFKGLIDECERLEVLFASFRQLKWLNGGKVSKFRYSWFRQLWSTYDKNDGQQDNKKAEQQDDKKAVLELYEEVIKRNKILILAPVKNAPSCSDEYEDIQNLLEFPVFSSESDSDDGEQFVTALRKIKREYQQTEQYELKNGNEYSNLRWAVFYPNKGNFLYLYMKSSEESEYSDVIPVYLDTERDAIAGILKKIEDGIIDEYKLSASENEACSTRERISECFSWCDTLIIDSENQDCQLRTLVNELLTFLQFDFHAARQIGYLGKEYILINYPRKSGFSPQDFSILAFENQLPEKESGKRMCDICRECFVRLSHDHGHPIKEEASKPLEVPSVDSCKIYNVKELMELRDKVYKEIDGFSRFNSEQKREIKNGKKIEGKNANGESAIWAEVCGRLNKCIEGKCNKPEWHDCETCRLLKENKFI